MVATDFFLRYSIAVLNRIRKHRPGLPKTGDFSGYSARFVAEGSLEVNTNEIILPACADEECRLPRCGVVWIVIEPESGGTRRLQLQGGKRAAGIHHGFLQHMICNVNLQTFQYWRVTYPS
jgi:hypothetical protein